MKNTSHAVVSLFMNKFVNLFSVSFMLSFCMLKLNTCCKDACVDNKSSLYGAPCKWCPEHVPWLP